MTKKLVGGVLVGMLAAGAAACATSPASPPKAGATPPLALEEYFLGRTEAWGVFQDRAGTLTRQFKVTIDGTWDGTVLTLDENFDYTDGAKERRVWTLRKTGPATWQGTAGDVRGVANGVIQGNQLSWVYDVDLKVNGRPILVTFDDRMWLQSDGVLINRAKVKKFGVTWGEATIVFQRPRP
jgi:Protein of unknown function (DUF3833)